MSNINNKHIPEDLDSLTRKDMVELFKIQVEEHQGFIKEIESLRTQLAKANERVKELERKEGLFDQYALESEVMRKALLNKDRNADDVSPSDLKQALNKFAIEKKLEVLNEFKKECGIILPAHKLQDKIEQLRKEQNQ